MLSREQLRAVRKIQIRTSHLVSDLFAGQYQSVFKGRGMEFAEVRLYQPGDDVRTIDWNVSARMNEPFVKVFVEEREMTVMLVVDLSASERFGTRRAPKARLASEVSALLAFSAIRNNDKVGLILFSDRTELFIPPKKGRSHALPVIREILFFQPQGRGTLPTLALDYLNHVVTRRSVVFFISDFQAEDFSRALTITSRRHDFIAVRIDDEREEVLPDIGLITLEDAETGEQIEINTGDRHVARLRFNDRRGRGALVLAAEILLRDDVAGGDLWIVARQSGILPTLHSAQEEAEFAPRPFRVVARWAAAP